MMRGDFRDAHEPSGRLPSFPWAEVQIVGLLVLVHLALVFWSGGPFASHAEVIRQGGLLRGGTLTEPWRLFTSLFLHSGPSHALWNGLSTLVFGVPLLTRLGFGRSFLIYFASGVGGGITALWFSEPETLIIGSSGAVAGLFGAWVVLTLRQARRETLSRRATFRAVGIALLVLPSLIKPFTASGRPISISSHLGGLLTGMLIGAILSLGMIPAAEEVEEEPPEPYEIH
jgi:membrane associated rhomboid family serine protease